MQTGEKWCAEGCSTEVIDSDEKDITICGCITARGACNYLNNQG
jgi:hypothetical protein